VRSTALGGGLGGRARHRARFCAHRGGRRRHRAPGVWGDGRVLDLAAPRGRWPRRGRVGRPGGGRLARRRPGPVRRRGGGGSGRRRRGPGRRGRRPRRWWRGARGRGRHRGRLGLDLVELQVGDLLGGRRRRGPRGRWRGRRGRPGRGSGLGLGLPRRGRGRRTGTFGAARPRRRRGLVAGAGVAGAGAVEPGVAAVTGGQPPSGRGGQERVVLFDPAPEPAGVAGGPACASSQEALARGEPRDAPLGDPAGGRLPRGVGRQQLRHAGLVRDRVGRRAPHHLLADRARRARRLLGPTAGRGARLLGPARRVGPSCVGSGGAPGSRPHDSPASAVIVPESTSR
jgi:hypothetical protein